MEYLRGLPDDSLTVALMQGGREHLGWTKTVHILASVVDAVNQNTRATGNWRSSPPKIEPHFRPKVKKAPNKITPSNGKKVTLEDIAASFGKAPIGR